MACSHFLLLGSEADVKSSMDDRGSQPLRSEQWRLWSKLSTPLDSTSICRSSTFSSMTKQLKPVITQLQFDAGRRARITMGLNRGAVQGTLLTNT